MTRLKITRFKLLILKERNPKKPILEYAVGFNEINWFLHTTIYPVLLPNNFSFSQYIKTMSRTNHPVNQEALIKNLKQCELIQIEVI